MSKQVVPSTDKLYQEDFPIAFFKVLYERSKEQLLP